MNFDKDLIRHWATLVESQTDDYIQESKLSKRDLEELIQDTFLDTYFDEMMLGKSSEEAFKSAEDEVSKYRTQMYDRFTLPKIKKAAEILESLGFEPRRQNEDGDVLFLAKGVEETRMSFRSVWIIKGSPNSIDRILSKRFLSGCALTAAYLRKACENEGDRRILFKAIRGGNYIGKFKAYVKDGVVFLERGEDEITCEALMDLASSISEDETRIPICGKNVLGNGETVFMSANLSKEGSSLAINGDVSVPGNFSKEFKNRIIH